MRRIGHRIGLKQASAIGLYGMVSALALGAAVPIALAQTIVNAAPPAGTSSAPAAVEAAAPAPAPAPAVAPPAETSMPASPASAEAAASSSSPAPEAAPATQAAAPAAERAAPPEAASTGVRSGGASARANQTRYSKRQKGSMGGADAAAQPGKSGAPSEIVCQAGCEQQPGAVVHVQPKPQAAAGAVAAVAAVDDDDDDDQPKTKTKAQAKATDPMMACLAGCWDGPAAFAGVPNATEGGYALTNAKMPGAKPASGEWLVKINRERGTGAGK